MKKYLNPNNEQLKEHLVKWEKNHGGEFILSPVDPKSVYEESARPENATRIWVSFDINSADKYKPLRNNLDKWFKRQHAESFGASVATFLVQDACWGEDEEVANWLMDELRGAQVLSPKDCVSKETPYLLTNGISLYVFYRSKGVDEKGETVQYSGHFVLIQNEDISHLGGYEYDKEPQKD